MFVGDGGAWRFDSSGPVLEPGQTYHLLVTYDGSVARLHVNGALVSTGPAVSMAPNAGANPMRLGSASSFVGQHWPGTLDEASFYPAPLAEAQILSHHDVSSTGSAATSPPTPVVVASPPANSASPSISGSAEVGEALTASSGSWSGTQPISFAYQWRRCDASGEGCTDIAAATEPTYALVSADEGSTVRVRVAASNAAGSSSADSAATAQVASQPTSGTLSFSLASGGDDGDLQQRSSVSGGYPPTGGIGVNSTGSVFTAGRRLAFGNYSVLVDLLRFDTSALPDDAVVTSATLKLHVTGKADANDRALQAEWYAAASWPIDAADFALDSSASALPGADLTAIATGQVSSFALASLTSVSVTGFTGLRLHISGGQPTGDNLIQFASYDHASLPEPQLVVEWSVP